MIAFLPHDVVLKMRTCFLPPALCHHHRHHAAADLIKSTMQNCIDKLPFQRLLMFDFLYSTAAAAALSLAL